MKPVIGITVDAESKPDDARTEGKLSLNWNYAEAVSRHGGVPILIPPTADMSAIASLIDGWLIPGGNDIDARNWGDENIDQVTLIEAERFDSEKRLMAEIPAEMPVLGICYGCQFINVARGGSLHQHLPNVIEHERHQGGTLQSYEVEPESKLAGAIGETSIAGKSYHHQAVHRLGENLQVVATDGEDHVVEALEATDRPWMVGVQWHPERTQEDERTQRLFESFVAAALDYAKQKRK